MSNKLTLVIVCFCLISLNAFTQESGYSRKNSFDVRYKFNFTDNDKVKPFAETGHTAQLAGTFGLLESIAVGPTFDYSYLKGFTHEHNFSLGADVILYPLHLIDQLRSKPYNPAKSKYYISYGYYIPLNKGDIKAVSNFNLYVYTFDLGNKLKVSPTFGATFYDQKNDKMSLDYISLGLTFRF